MLCLGDEVGSAVSRIGFIVGDNQHLGRSVKPVDTHRPVKQLLCQKNIDVSRTAYLVHHRDRLRTESQSGNSLGAAHGKHAVNPGDTGSSQRYRVHSPVFLRRRNQDYLSHSCDLRRDSRHQQR